MDIRDAILGVRPYGHRLGKEQSAQQHLWSIPRQPPKEFPLGLRVRVSGSAQSLPVVPWIALLDEDVTDTATDGLYLCYLYTRALDGVYLSMNQGATQHRRMAETEGLKGRAAEKAAMAEIASETTALRDLVEAAIPSGAADTIALGASNFLPLAYEAGNVAAMYYSLDSLPSTATMAGDLADFAQLYAACVGVKDDLAAKRQVRTSARSAKRRQKTQPAPPEFRPKDAADYVANVKAATQKRSRKHEALLKEYGEAVIGTGRSAATNVHPRDLTVMDGSFEWLVEAKTVGLNAEHAVRAAIGQLLSYRHFFYRTASRADPRLLALFDAPIGVAFENLLASLDIEVTCRDGADWSGSPEALHLIEPQSE